MFLSNPCKVKYPTVPTNNNNITYKRPIFDVRTDVIVNLFIIRSAQLVKLLAMQ